MHTTTLKPAQRFFRPRVERSVRRMTCPGIYPHAINIDKCEPCNRKNVGIILGRLLIAVGDWLLVKFGGL